jgi:hypothetical protein
MNGTGGALTGKSAAIAVVVPNANAESSSAIFFTALSPQNGFIQKAAASIALPLPKATNTFAVARFQGVLLWEVIYLQQIETNPRR